MSMVSMRDSAIGTPDPGLVAATRPSVPASARRQAGKAPSPGSTMRSARATSSGREVTRTSPPPTSAAMRWKAFSAEWRLPLS